MRRGETEYAIGAIPLGGYVKITGMNPAEEIPPEVAHRAYYRQPVWKRIVVIAAGPAVNIVLAFVLLTASCWSGARRRRPRTASSRLDKTGAAAQVLRPGDRVVAVDGKRGDAVTLRDQIATHRCAGEPGRRLQGRRAGAGHGDPRRARADLRDHAGLRRRASSGRCSASATARRSPRRSAVGRRRRARQRRPDVVRSPRTTVETIAGIFEAEKREQISGVVGSYETTRQAIELRPTARCSCSR